MWRRGVFLGISYAPYRNVAGHKRNPILGFPSINAYTLQRRTTKFDVVTHMGGGLFSDGQPRPHPKDSGAPQSSPILSVPLYTSLFHHQIVDTHTHNLIFMHTPFDAELPNFTW